MYREPYWGGGNWFWGGCGCALLPVGLVLIWFLWNVVTTL